MEDKRLSNIYENIELYDIWLRSDIADNNTRLEGRILLDKDGHFEGVVNKRKSLKFELVTGDLLIEKGFGLVELTVYRSQGDSRPSLKLEGESTGLRFIGKSHLKTTEAMVECGTCSIGIQHGEVIRDVTPQEKDAVQYLILRGVEDLNEDSLTQYMSQKSAKQYRKEMQNK